MIKYCPICHREAYRLVEEGEDIRVMQGTRSVMTVTRKSKVSLGLFCPNRHPVQLELKPEEGEEG